MREFISLLRRAKKGMFNGDLEQGELEIGQISGLIQEIKPAAEIVKEVIAGFEQVKKEVGQFEKISRFYHYFCHKTKRPKTQNKIYWTTNNNIV